MRVLLLVVIVLAAGRGAEPPTSAAIEADLWRMVPQRWRPLPIPAHDAPEDAGTLIIAAGSSVGSRTLDEAVYDICSAAAQWRKPWPTGADADALTAWLDAPPRHQASAILDRALLLGTRRPPPAEGPDKTISPGRDLMRFLVLRARRAAETGDFAQAEVELRRMGGLAHMLRGGHGGIALLSQVSLAAQVHDAVVAVGVRMPPQPAALERLRPLVMPADDLGEESVTRTQLASLIASLARAPEDGDRWVQDLQAMHLKGALLREGMRKTTGATTPASDRSAIFALSGAPQALDRRATVQLALDMLAAIEAAGGKAAWQRGPVHDLVAETSLASRYLNPAQDLLGDMTTALGTGGAGKDGEADAGKQADAAFRRLAGQANPVGRILVGMEMSVLPFMLESARRGVARCRMTLIAISLLAHRAQHGSLPDVLPPGSPLDPCTGTPFRWDAARRLLWSVGKNGTDEQGDPRKDDVVRLYAGPDP